MTCILHVFEDNSIPEEVFNITQIKYPIQNHDLFKIQTRQKILFENSPKTIGVQKYQILKIAFW